MRSALTILNAYIVAGRPNQHLAPWGSYESWSALVRNAIVWCGEEDPGNTRRVLQETSDETANGLTLFIAGMEKIDPDRHGLTAGEIITAAFSQDSTFDATVKVELTAAIDAISHKREARALGNALRPSQKTAIWRSVHRHHRRERGKE